MQLKESTWIPTFDRQTFVTTGFLKRDDSALLEYIAGLWFSVSHDLAAVPDAYANAGNTCLRESTICMGLTPSVGSSFEFFSFRAIAFFFPTHPRLYIAIRLDTPGLCRIGVGSFSSAEASPGAHLGLLTT